MVRIVFDNRLDSKIISNDTLIVLEQKYSSVLPVETTYKFSNLNVAEKAAFKTLVDSMVYRLEESFLVWNIEAAGKNFDLSKSIIRDDVDADNSSEMTTSAPLVMIFEFAGFDTNLEIPITLFYDDAFLPSDLALLDAAGVEITGDGKSFTIVNSVDVRVKFEKPATASGDYMIDFKPLVIVK